MSYDLGHDLDAIHERDQDAAVQLARGDME